MNIQLADAAFIELEQEIIKWQKHLKRTDRKKLLIYIHVAVPWKPPYAEKLINFD